VIVALFSSEGVFWIKTKKKKKKSQNFEQTGASEPTGRAHLVRGRGGLNRPV
jgi:hypothetical protein